MVFAAGPNTRIYEHYSYFSTMHIGYADWSPILTAAFAIAASGCLCYLLFRRANHPGFVPPDHCFARRRLFTSHALFAYPDGMFQRIWSVGCPLASDCSSAAVDRAASAQRESLTKRLDDCVLCISQVECMAEESRMYRRIGVIFLILTLLMATACSRRRPHPSNRRDHGRERITKRRLSRTTVCSRQ
jgi:hypothetical protein